MCLATISGLRRLNVGASITPPRSRSGIVEEVAVMRRAAAVGDHHGHPFLTPGPPGPLPVVGGPRRHVSHQGHVQGPDVDAHFQRRRGDEAVGAPVLGT